MATQEQVNIEIGKIYSQTLEYISKRVQGSDTFSGLSGNQHAALEALAKKANAQIAELELKDATQLQKIRAMNVIGNQISELLISAPNSPYKNYTPQQVNVIAMQSILGGEKEYTDFGNLINDTLKKFALQIEFIENLESGLFECYRILNGDSPSPSSMFARNNGDLFSSTQLEKIEASLSNLRSVGESLQDSIFCLSTLAENYYTVNDSNLRELGFVRERGNPLFLIPAIPAAVKAVMWVTAGCVIAYEVFFTSDLIVKGKVQSTSTNENIVTSKRLSFCLEVQKALELLYTEMQSNLVSSIMDDSKDPKLMLINLSKLKENERFQKIETIQSEEYTLPNSIGLLSNGEKATFTYGKDCITGQLFSAQQVLASLPNEAGINNLTKPERQELANNLIDLCGGRAKLYAEAATFSLARENVAYERSGLADDARRRRAVTHLIEWATYGAVSVGVIWGLSKVYKSYESDD